MVRWDDVTASEDGNWHWLGQVLGHKTSHKVWDGCHCASSNNHCTALRKHLPKINARVEQQKLDGRLGDADWVAADDDPSVLIGLKTCIHRRKRSANINRKVSSKHFPGGKHTPPKTKAHPTHVAFGHIRTRGAYTRTHIRSPKSAPTRMHREFTHTY